MPQWNKSSEENVLVTLLHFISPGAFIQCNNENYHTVCETQNLFFSENRLLISMEDKNCCTKNVMHFLMPMPIIWQQPTVLYQDHNCKKNPNMDETAKKLGKNLWWSRDHFYVCLKTTQKIEGSERVWALVCCWLGVEQGLCSTKVWGYIPVLSTPRPWRSTAGATTCSERATQTLRCLPRHKVNWRFAWQPWSDPIKRHFRHVVC